MRTITFVQEFMFCPISDIHANLAAVGWVRRGYSEQYSGFQTVIVLYGLPILKEMTAWKPGYPAYGREISVETTQVAAVVARVQDEVRGLVQRRLLVQVLHVVPRVHLRMHELRRIQDTLTSHTNAQKGCACARACSPIKSSSVILKSWFRATKSLRHRRPGHTLLSLRSTGSSSYNWRELTPMSP